MIIQVNYVKQELLDISNGVMLVVCRIELVN